MKIMALSRYGTLAASSRLRTYQYVDKFSAFDIEFYVEPLFDNNYVTTIYANDARRWIIFSSFFRRVKALLSARKFDAIWIEKEMLPWLPAFVELSLFPSGLPMIVDLDDAVFHRYDGHRSHAVRAILGRKLDRLMRRADLVVAGNDYLAERAREAGASRVETVPTVVDLKRYMIGPKLDSKDITIGWIGSPSTAHYLDIIKPVLDELSLKIPLRAIAIGARQDQLSGSIFVARPWTEDTEVQEIAQFDIGVMPLLDNPWERGKCGYKIIQYMASGVPVVASPVGVNKKIVREANGFLASSKSDWLLALRQLVTDRRLRLSMGSFGRADVERRYTLDVQAPRLASFIKAVVQK
ncbi:MAG: glycosyltransferase family 4 protein [Mesorhizobium sp.]|uniref:glycosyltransferase family 4 protein n=1 Tax=Mesorhizobium sp. TaxID=1871066 RepID=UPI001AD50DBD|nr:glycosyltransferase family 4 protein [Mesorhizobium sp.]MBN9220967.1 glycosyltransferase family 4 protein [Mesorhizobium sp.]